MRILVIIAAIFLVNPGSGQTEIDRAHELGAIAGVVFSGRPVLVENLEPLSFRLEAAGKVAVGLAWKHGLAPFSECGDTDKECEDILDKACKDAGHTACSDGTGKLKHMENGDIVCSCDCSDGSGAVAFKICSSES